MGGTITLLKVKSEQRGRVLVYLDGEPAFSLAGLLAARFRLGQSLSDGEIESLKRQDEVEVACQRAMRLIRNRPRAERELRQKFERDRLAPETQEAVIGRLRVAGLVDDEGFAQAWVENRSAFRPRAARMLRYELRQKGIPAVAIDLALQGYDEDQAAGAAACKAARRLSQLSEDDFKRRLSQYLARRGFEHATISPVVERLWREITDNGNESEGNL